MQNSALFRGFTDIEVQKMLKCLGAKVRICNTNETIMSHNTSSDYLYIVLSGTAELASYDYDGNKSLLARFGKDSAFGDVFFAPLSNDEYMVTATSECKILSFSYHNALFQCENVCKHHTKFIDNLFSLISKKIITNTQHIEILTKRSIKEKLLAYFSQQEKENNASLFTLPISLSSLADYMGIDRSAMQREIRRLNDEGIIESKGKTIRLIKKEKKF